MALAYAAVLRLHICSTDVRAQKIDESTFLSYSMMLVNFQLENKQEDCWLSKKSL